MKNLKFLINEISQGEINNLKNWLAEKEVENPDFEKLFGGKQRIIVPFTKGGAKGTIGEIIKFFTSQGFEIDLKSGLVKKEVEYEIPKGEKKGQKIKKNFKERIGKVLKLFEEYHLALGNEQKRDTLSKKIGKIFHIPGNTPLIDVFFGRGDEPGQGYKWSKWWSKNSEFYRKNPEAAEQQTQYSIVISKSPIDILKMSDFSDIQSCHSEGASYFKCAIAESRNGGLIAYLVNTEDLENIDLDEEEIFEDKRRGVQGIKPVSRLRLRKYGDTTKDIFFAVPEKRVYGKRPPGLYDEIRNWAWENQKEIFEEGLPEMEQIQSYGGSYRDTKDGELFNSFFKTEKYPDYMDVEHNLDGEDEVNDVFDEWEHRADEIDEYARENLKHITTWHNLEGDEEPYLLFDASFGYRLEDDEVNYDAMRAINNDFKTERELSNKIKKIIGYEADEMEFEYSSTDLLLRFSIHSGDYDSTPDGYEEFVDYLKDIDRNVPKLERKVRQLLAREGILIGGELEKALEKIEQDGYKHFTTTEDRSGDIDINLRQDLVITTRKEEIKAFEEHKDKIKFFKSSFNNKLKKLQHQAHLFAYGQLPLKGIGREISSPLANFIFFHEDWIDIKKHGSAITLDFDLEIEEDIRDDQILYYYKIIEYFDRNFEEIENSAKEAFYSTWGTYYHRKLIGKETKNESHYISPPSEEDIISDYIWNF